MINPISKEITKLLLLQDTNLSSREIASKLGVSTKAVQYRLPEIKEWLQKQSAELVIQPYHGLSIVASDSCKEKILKLISGPTDYFSTEDRYRLIVLSLLIESQPIPIKRLEYAFNISRGTVLKDLKIIDSKLKKRGLVLQRKPHIGIYIEGIESRIRSTILEVIGTVLGNDLLLSICESPVKEKMDLIKERFPVLYYDEYIINLDLSWYYQLIRNLSLGENPVVFSIEGIVALTKYLAITVHRVKEGHKILPGEINQNINIADYHKTISKIYDSIYQIKNVKLDDEELNAVVTQIMLARKNRSNEISKIIEDDRVKIPGILAIILKEAAIYLSPNLSVDVSLQEGLTHHLEGFLINRFYSEVRVNPFLEKIREEFDYIYKTTLNIAQKIQDEYGIFFPEDEAAYIAMYLAAAMERLYTLNPAIIHVYLVCNEGLATSWLLANRLKSEFPQIEIDAVLSVLELRNKDIAGIDAIITTVMIPEPKTQTVIVSPLLLDEDIEKLKRLKRRNIPEKKQAQETSNIEGPSLSEILKKSYIYFCKKIVTVDKAIEIASLPLITDKVISIDFVSAIKNSLLNNGPYMVLWPGIALLHAQPTDGAMKLGLSLTRFKYPIKFGHPQNDPVDILFVLATVDKKKHLKALLQLIDLVTNKDFLKSVRTTTEADYIIKLLPSS
jgi:transcriptional antiterminator/mannitol/fructose-specific phosphotransferase system IIA component (Ntr-type)